MNSIFKYNTQYTSMRIFLLPIFITWLVSIGCKKLAETPVPTDQIAENAVYSNDATAIAVLSALYKSMNSGPIQGSAIPPSIGITLGLAADEFSITTPYTTSTSVYVKYYQNDLSQGNPPLVSGGEHWAPFYNFIFLCNAAIQGLNSPNASSLTPAIHQQLLGEAKFMRAFFYFYLVNEFGNVPLVLTTNPQTNTALHRIPKQEIYAQIINDLLEAEEKLSSEFLDITLSAKTSERVRPTKWAASALLSRVYLYMEDFAKAEQKATAVLNNNSLFELLPNLNDVFIKNSKEAIWQIQPTDQNMNTREGLALIIPATGPGTSNGNSVYLSKQLLNTFEANDKRSIYGNWIDTTIYKLNSTPAKNDTMPFVYKYKMGASTVTTLSGLTEYFMVLRIAEQYLIRAEARAQLMNIGGAQSDLNAIRKRAGLGNTTAGDKTSLLTAILHERQVELFGEWGHRWLDLKRTGHIDEVMNIITPIKANGALWRSYQQWFPVPIKDILASTDLSQNDGY